MKPHKCIAVIPARGGSKRIPRKNVLDFFGKPMVAWTIEAALDSDRFDRVLVSTDDADIAATARAFGAEVPFLRYADADDHAHVSAATLNALAQAEDYWKESYNTVVQLMPNCPLRGAADIAAALDVFAARASSFQISCFKYGWMNPWWAATLDAEGHPTQLFEATTKARSQDLDELYCPTGAIWIAEVEALRLAGSFYGPGHVFEPLNWMAAVDIDDDADFQMARAVRLMMNNEGRGHV